MCKSRVLQYKTEDRLSSIIIQNKKVGLAGNTEKEVAEFKERRPTSDLCDECLIDEISAKSRNLAPLQD